MPLEHLFSSIQVANKGLEGRIQGLHYGVVSNTKDPLSLGRIKCLDAAKGGNSDTFWLFRILPFPGFSPPLPRIGDTVLMGFIEGNPHDGVYFGSLQNIINPVINDGKNLVIWVGTSKVTINPDGNILIETETVNVNAPNFRFNDAQSVTINGKEIATLGGNVASGVIVGRGW